MSTNTTDNCVSTKPMNIGAKRIDTVQADPMQLSEIPAETSSSSGSERHTKATEMDLDSEKQKRDEEKTESTQLYNIANKKHEEAVSMTKSKVDEVEDEDNTEVVIGKQKQQKRVLDSDSDSDSGSHSDSNSCSLEDKDASVSRPDPGSKAKMSKNEAESSRDPADEVVAKSGESKLPAPPAHPSSVNNAGSKEASSSSDSSDSDSSDSDVNTAVKKSKSTGVSVAKSKPRKLRKSQRSSSSSSSDDSSKASKPKTLKKNVKGSAKSSSSSSSSSDSDSDSDADSKAPILAQKKGRARKSKKTVPTEQLPDPSNLEKCSSHALSAKEIRALPSWAYLIVEDKSNKRTWRLPVRDKTGTINKPLLTKVRQALITGKDKGRQLDARITSNVQKRIGEVFQIAWPGLPLPKLADGLLADDEEEYDMEGQDDHWLSATQSLRQDTQSVLKDLGADGKTEEQEEQERLQQEEALRQRLEKEAAERKERESAGASLVAKMRARRSGAAQKQPSAKAKKSQKKAHTSLIVFELSPANAPKPRKRKKSKSRAAAEPLPQSPNARRRAFKKNLLHVARNHLAEKRAIESGYKTVDAQLEAKEAADLEDEEDEEALLVAQHESDEEKQRPVQDNGDDRDAEKRAEAVVSVQEEKQEKEAEKDEIVLATPQCTEELDDDADMDGDVQEPIQAPVRTYSKKALDASKSSRNNDVTRTLKAIGVYPAKQSIDESEGKATTPGGGDASTETEEKSVNAQEEKSNVERESKDEDATAGKPGGDESREVEEEAKPQQLRKNKSNAMYRALLERENQLAQRQRKARSKKVLEDEASEEEDDDDGVGDYGLGRSNPAKKDESDLGAERVRKEDLEAIVDTISDDEGEDLGDGIEYHQELMKAKEEEGLKKLQDDVENHRIAYKKARRRDRSSRLDTALDESSDDESTDEEVEMARQERYRSVDEQRRRLAAGGSQLAQGESLEDVENEIEQREQFLQAAKMHKKRIRNKKGRTGKASGALLKEFIGEENTQLVQRIRRCNTTLVAGKTKSSSRSFLSQTQRTMTGTSNDGFKLKTLSSKVVFLEESSNENVQANKKRKCESSDAAKAVTKKKKASGLMRALTRQ